MEVLLCFATKQMASPAGGGAATDAQRCAHERVSNWAGHTMAQPTVNGLAQSRVVGDSVFTRARTHVSCALHLLAGRAARRLARGRAGCAPAAVVSPRRRSSGASGGRDRATHTSGGAAAVVARHVAKAGTAATNTSATAPMPPLQLRTCRRWRS
jgi:hypothetical protein